LVVAAKGDVRVRLVGAAHVREVSTNVGDLAGLAGGVCRFSFNKKAPVRPVEVVIVQKGPVVRPNFRALGGNEWEMSFRTEAGTWNGEEFVLRVPGKALRFAGRLFLGPPLEVNPVVAGWTATFEVEVPATREGVQVRTAGIEIVDVKARDSGPGSEITVGARGAASGTFELHVVGSNGRAVHPVG
jgi:hypothetical protein